MTTTSVAEPVFADPSVVGPDLQFSTGTVGADGMEQYDPALPDLSGSADPGWNITQWNTPAAQIFDPTRPILADAADHDPLLGSAVASWHSGTAASGSTLVVYGAPGSITYRLGASGGSTRDTFLQTTGYASGRTSFDHPLLYTASERVVTASAAGGGTALAFNAFTVFFNASDNPSYSASLPTDELFLQVPLVDFRGEPGPYQTFSRGYINRQIYNLSSQSYSSAAGTTVSDATANYLPFAADPGPLHSVRIDLNQALLRMVQAMAQQDPAQAAAYLDLSRWSLGSVYAGVETSANGGSSALALDIAHPIVTEDTSREVSSAMPLSTVQSIDGNQYALQETANRVTTLPGTVNSIALVPDALRKTVTSNGTDTVSIGSDETVALHADGGRLTVIGQMTTGGSVTIDGPAPVSTRGSFATLGITSSAAGDLVTGSATGARLSLGGSSARVQLSSAAAVTLSGSGAVLADDGGTVTLQATGAMLDLDGNGSQTIQLDGESAAITETGTGSQTIIGAAARTGSVRLSGGEGSQIFWTGGTSGTVTASADAGPLASLQIHAQTGSSTTVQLGTERTIIDGEGGQVTVEGSLSTAATATIQGGPGSITVQGGAERLVASDGNAGSGTMQIQAGSGSQTIFGGREALLVEGSHSTAGSQTIVNGTDSADGTTIVGGLTRQVVWTGDAHDRIFASGNAADASGTIQAFIQGGASSYWGGAEQASLDNQAGILDAFLQGGGHVSIRAELAGATTTILQGFNRLTDTLTLGGVSAPSRLHVACAGGNTTLSLGAGSGTVVLDGVSHVTLCPTAAGLQVLG